MKGRIVKGVGGFYFVHDGSSVVMGKARGILKRNKELLYVGDIVDYDIDTNDSDNECVINYVAERRNYLTRPPVSNLDILVVVFSIIEPDVNYPIIDKLLAGAERSGIRPVICISKKDLVSAEVLGEAIDHYKDIYPVTAVDGLTGDGITELFDLISGSSAALAGPSGAGKSTITNQLISMESDETVTAAETGRVSSKTGRGRHTTRHVEIFPLKDDTWLYDTPGFTSLELQGAEAGDIGSLMPEIRALAGECRYRNCIHINEPECAVKDALAEGRISRSRYSSYLIMVEEAKNRKG